MERHGGPGIQLEEEKEPDLRIENKCQAFLLVLIGALMFAVQVAAMVETDSWVLVRTGLRKVSGNLPTGSDEFTGTYPSVEICYAIADVSRVGGFVWVPVSGSSNQVHCEFKTSGTPLEGQAVVNRTAVIKGQSGASCGVFDCSKSPFSKTIDFYDCDVLIETIRTFQGFAILGAIMLGVHFLVQFAMWTEVWGSGIGRAVYSVLPMSYCAQAIFLTISWASMVAAYAFEFCGRRVRSVASLNYGIYFFIANTVLSYACYVLTTSAFKKKKPPPIVRPELRRHTTQRRKSTLAMPSKVTSLNSANL